MNLLFFETSAKTGANIKVLFNELAKKLTGIETNPISNAENETSNNTGFKLGEEKDPGAGGEAQTKEKKKKKCC